VLSNNNSDRVSGEAFGHTFAPLELVQALAAYARHDAAIQRHLLLLARLQSAEREVKELRATMDRLREHNLSAAAEMRDLRAAVESYTHSLRDRGVTPERALVAIRTGVANTIAQLPPFERPQDVPRLSSDLVQCAIKAYFAA
jgi:hypothetical protein